MLKPLFRERQFPCDPTPDERARPVRSRRVNLSESPLTWLHSRGQLTDLQLLAGETLRRDYERAALAPLVTMQWDAPPRNKGPRGPEVLAPVREIELSAKARFLGAIDRAGPGLGDIVWRVVCAGETIPVAERFLNWPSRCGRIILALGLDRVASFYQLKR